MTLEFLLSKNGKTSGRELKIHYATTMEGIVVVRLRIDTLVELLNAGKIWLFACMVEMGANI